MSDPLSQRETRQKILGQPHSISDEEAQGTHQVKGLVDAAVVVVPVVVPPLGLESL